MVDTDTYFFKGQELLEISVVNIPANPEAVRRNYRDFTANALNYMAFATKKSFSELENMTIGEAINLMKGVKAPEKEKEETEESEEISTPKLSIREKLLNLSSKEL